MSEDRFAEQAVSWLRALDLSSELEAAEERQEERLRRLLLGLLDIVDACDRLLEPARDSARGPSARGRSARERPATVQASSVALVRRQLERLLAGEGVVAVDPLGSEPDPARHRVLEVRESDGGGDEVIVEVLTRGYRWGEAALRLPDVVVGRKRKEKE